jgi:NAD(P)H dehydrogenase (quinone)
MINKEKIMDTLEIVTRKPRIAIAGATGRVGSTLINLLAADPVEIVALSRRLDHAGFPQDVEVATIDFDNKKTLEDALLGVDRLFIAHGTSPQQVANEIALINGAVAAGVRHIVKLSVMGPAARIYPYAWHMEIEAHLAQQPIASTVIRPSAFVDILKRFADQIAAGSWIGAAGNGRVNFIDTRDVAKVARIALLEDISPDSQRAYHLTGPRAWTMQQLAEEFSGLLDQRVVYKHRTPQEHRTALLAGGVSPFVVDLLIGLDQVFRESVNAETTNTVKDLTGEAARDTRKWLIENVALFQAAPSIGAEA